MAKSGRGILVWHRGFLAGVGIAYAFSAAEVFRNVAGGLGLLRDPLANPVALLPLALPILLPLVLLFPKVLPGFVRAPTRWFHVLLAIVVVQLLSMAGEFPIAVQGTAAGLPAEMIAANSSRFVPLFGIVCFVAMIVTGTRAVIQHGKAAKPAKQETLPPVVTETPATERFATLSIHRALIALYGVGALTVGAGILVAFQRDPAFASLYSDLGVRLPITAAAAFGVLAGISLLFTRTMPGFVARPTRWFHFFGIGLYLTVCAVVAPLVFALLPVFQVAAQYTDPALVAWQGEFFSTRLMLLPGHMTSQLLGTLTSLGLIVTSILVIRRKPEVANDDALRPYSSQRVSDIPQVTPRRNMNKGKLPEPKLPSIGAAMKLYVVADWLVMRLLGLGLLGTAYILWQLIRDNRIDKALKVSYGQDPMYALYTYAAVGTLLAVPFLLPRFITAPRKVVGGLLKAILLVATAFILLPMVHVAIEMFTPEIYWATLHATAPSLFKAVAGIAVTSALLISFFRQLGATQQVDYTGKPVIVLSEQELRSLRSARMES